MNLKALSELNLQQTSTVPKPTQTKRVQNTSPVPQNQRIRDPNHFQAAKTQNAQQFQAKRTVQGQLQNLAILSGKNQEQNPPQVQPKRVSSDTNGPQKRGGFLQRLRQVGTQATNTGQLGQLIREMTTPTQNTPTQNTPTQNTPTTPPLANLKPVSSGKYIDTQDFKLYGTRHQALMQSMFQNAPKGSKLHRYATILKLMTFLKQAEKGKGPLANDPQALSVLKQRKAQLKTELMALAKDPSIKAAFDKVKTEAQKSVFGKNPKAAAKSFADYLTGPEFAKKLNGLPKEKQRELLKTELSKLAILDSSQIPNVVKKFAEQGLAQKTLQAVQKGGPQALALEKKMEASIAKQLTGTLTNTGKIPKIAQSMVKIIKAIKLDDINDVSKLKKLIQKFYPDQADQKALMQILEKADFKMSKLLAGLGIVSGAVGLVTASSREDKTSALSALADAGSNLGSVLSYLNKGADAGLMASKGAKYLAKGLEFLGPIGDVLGIASDAMGLQREQSNEDVMGQTAKWISIASGGLAAAAGTYMATLAALSAETGPGAPFALALGTVGGLVALGVDSLFGESETTGQIRQDLRDLGITDREDRVGKETTRLNFAGLTAEQISQKLQSMNATEKAHVINYLMDEVWVTPKQEAMIFNILKDIKDPKELMAVTSKLDMSKVAGNLERDNQAVGLFKHLLKAAKATGNPTGPVIENYIKGLAQNNRTDALKTIFQDKEVLAQLSPEQFKRLKAMGTPKVAQAHSQESYIYTSQTSFDKIRQDMKTALPDQKAKYINGEMNRTYVRGNRETLLYNILKDTQGQNLLKVLQHIDTAKLASHLETDKQAVDLAKHMLQMYKDLKKPVGPELKHYLRKLATSGRKEALKAFFNLPEVKNHSLISAADAQDLHTLTTLGSQQVNKLEGTFSTNTNDFKLIRATIRGLKTPKQKAEAIDAILNHSYVSSTREKAVHDILTQDIPLKELPEVLNEVNVKKIAHELENDDQVVNLALRFAQAYKQNGLSNIAPLEAFVKQLSADKRDGALKKILNHPKLKEHLNPAQIMRLKNAAARPEATVSKNEGWFFSFDADFAKIRSDLKKMPPAQKARAIKQLLNVTVVTSSRETLIKNILLDTPKEQLPELFKNLDGPLLISHLENRSEAAAVLKHLLAGYRAKGQKIDGVFEGLLTKLKQSNRPGPILDLLNAAKGQNPSLVKELSADSYKALMLDLPTNQAGQDVRKRLAYDSSWGQFNQFVEGMSDYQTQAFMQKLSPDMQKTVYSWMTYKSISAGARNKLNNALIQQLKSGGSGAAKLAQGLLTEIKTEKTDQLGKLPRPVAKALYDAMNNYLNGTWVFSTRPPKMIQVKDEMKKIYGF